MFSRQSIKSRRGFTLTELAIVLGVVGLILGAIWVAAASVYENFRTSRAATEVITVVQNLKTLYGGGRGTLDPDGTDITATAILAGMLPLDMVEAGNTTNGVGPWAGSQVTVTSAANWNAVSVSYWNLSQTACNRFAGAVATGNVFTADGLVFEAINTTGRTLPPIGNDVPYTATDVSTACKSGSSNHVQVTYSMN